MGGHHGLLSTRRTGRRRTARWLVREEKGMQDLEDNGPFAFALLFFVVATTDLCSSRNREPVVFQIILAQRPAGKSIRKTFRASFAIARGPHLIHLCQQAQSLGGRNH
nr:hypothetical protein [Pandoravirus massiliensis]